MGKGRWRVVTRLNCLHWCLAPQLPQTIRVLLLYLLRRSATIIRIWILAHRIPSEHAVFRLCFDSAEGENCAVGIAPFVIVSAKKQTKKQVERVQKLHRPIYFLIISEMNFMFHDRRR